MAYPPDFQLPDPWMPGDFLRDGGSISGPSAIASSGWGAANQGIAIPIVFPVAATIYSVSFAAGNGTGNFDIALYRPDFVLVQSLGTTAMTAAGKKTLTLTNDYRVAAGEMIYVGLVGSSTSGTNINYNFGTNGDVILTSVAVQASAIPLPDPFVPAEPASSLKIPVVALGIR